jgi:hypothetical protein
MIWIIWIRGYGLSDITSPLLVGNGILDKRRCAEFNTLKTITRAAKRIRYAGVGLGTTHSRLSMFESQTNNSFI